MKGKKSWRLSKTLSRNITFRPIEDADVKYAWAAYKQGKLGWLSLPNDLNASKFKEEFEKFVLTRSHAAWTIITNTKNGFIPVGIALGQWGPSFMFISAIEWFPWATRRNIVECTVYFFNNIRKQFPVLGFANEDHRPLYDVCAKHGIMQRVGTSYCMGEKRAVFESRNG